ncbi:MAG: hypothetical protein HFH89_06115 [Lachnospiraceae bacterium]|nr:hypothetical protein [uncultured Acetatifactor sp.]MCI8287221.1 hypothetical protein [Lachnospiraceae bacterium]
MSIEVNTNRNTGVREITIKRPDGSKVGTITIRSQSLKKLKKLGYKQRRISTMITQATTSGNAKQVLASAKTETVNLRRKLVSGKYNDREVRAAIRHAERMERVAKKRMKHLQQEEYIEKHGGGTLPTDPDEREREEGGWEMDAADFAEMSAEELEQLMEELQEEMEELAREQEMEELELMQTVRTDMDPAELEQLKKKHRADEMREIVEADMKYLKALFSQLEKERQEASSGDSGVALQLAGVEIPIQVDTRSAAEVASAAAPPAAGGTIDVAL